MPESGLAQPGREKMDISRDILEVLLESDVPLAPRMIHDRLGERDWGDADPPARRTVYKYLNEMLEGGEFEEGEQYEWGDFRKLAESNEGLLEAHGVELSEFRIERYRYGNTNAYRARGLGQRLGLRWAMTSSVFAVITGYLGFSLMGAAAGPGGLDALVSLAAGGGLLYISAFFLIWGYGPITRLRQRYLPGLEPTAVLGWIRKRLRSGRRVTT